MQGLFVTGTDTEVGKTVLSAALLAAMRDAGEEVVAHKPAVTGLSEPPRGEAQPWPADHELLAAAAAMAPEQVTPRRFAAAVAPPLAAAMAGESLARADVLDAAHAALASCEAGDGQAPATLIVEGAGGLLSPLAGELTVCDLAVALRLPVLIAARPGLGTINHALLTLQSARAAGLDVRAVVLTPWPERPSRLQSYNREAIARLGLVEVDVLGLADGAQIGELARIGAKLPWRHWLGAPSTVLEPA
jgi:dethiobiotin synthetase